MKELSDQTIKMNHRILLSSLAILLLVAQSDATSRQRLSRRQSNEDSGSESTTATSAQSQDATPSTQSQPPRLYPDLPRPPTVAFVPPFGAQNNNPNGPASFVPFGFQGGANNRFGDPPFRPMQPRPMTPTERLQSQTFTSGLGRRLLSLMGIGSSHTNGTASNNENFTITTEPQSNRNSLEETMRALRNSTVLRQLNGGVQSVYGSLSRMYNSTVQQQLDLLQERYMKEASNSTDPRQQRMAQQIPQFFRAMAMKVNEAQENLNRVWNQVVKANNNTNTNGAAIPNKATSQPLQLMNTRSADSFDQMMGGNADGGNFLNQIGRSFGAGPDSMDDDPLYPRQDMVSRLMDFWHNQVQPQMGMVRGQMMRIWRDLTSSGAFRPGMQMGGGRGRGGGGGNGMGSNNGNNTTDIVDDVLRDIETNEPEFKLIDSKTGNEQGPPMIPPRVQNGVVAMQRELNQLWNGLTNSIMNAMNMMSARRRNMNGQEDNNNNQEMDPAENEISDRLKDLSKLQKDADVVYDTVQRQQQQQQQQQRPTFTDRFMNFFGNMDFGSMGDQLGNRFGDSVTRFGNVVGDMWN